MKSIENKLLQKLFKIMSYNKKILNLTCHDCDFLIYYQWIGHVFESEKVYLICLVSTSKDPK